MTISPKAVARFGEQRLEGIVAKPVQWMAGQNP